MYLYLFSETRKGRKKKNNPDFWIIFHVIRPNLLKTLLRSSSSAIQKYSNANVTIFVSKHQSQTKQNPKRQREEIKAKWMSRRGGIELFFCFIHSSYAYILRYVYANGMRPRLTDVKSENIYKKSEEVVRDLNVLSFVCILWNTNQITPASTQFQVSKQQQHKYWRWDMNLVGFLNISHYFSSLLPSSFIGVQDYAPCTGTIKPVISVYIYRSSSQESDSSYRCRNKRSTP